MNNEQVDFLISGFKELHADIKEMKAPFYEMGFKISAMGTACLIPFTNTQNS